MAWREVESVERVRRSSGASESPPRAPLPGAAARRAAGGAEPQSDPQAGAVGTEGDDRIHVSRDEDGGLTVSVNGRRWTAQTEADLPFVITGGAGNDGIVVDADVLQAVRIDGGAGDDVIQGGGGRDLIDGGAGRDVIRGGGDRDLIRGGLGADSLFGGGGDDVLYGLEGQDRLRGEGGRDYLDGGADADAAWGGSGRDILSGGRGADRLDGGSGADTLAGGRDADRYASDGRDRYYTERQDRAPTAGGVTRVEMGAEAAEPGRNIEFLHGMVKPEGQTQQESDVDTLRSLPSGRSLLEGLDSTGRRTALNAYPLPSGMLGGGGDNSAQPLPQPGRPVHPDEFELGADGRPGPGVDALVTYSGNGIRMCDGAEDWQEHPPVVTLQHELTHAYNFQSGTKERGQGANPGAGPESDDQVERSELQAVGILPESRGTVGKVLAWLGIRRSGNPEGITENDLREDLGLPDREWY